MKKKEAFTTATHCGVESVVPHLRTLPGLGGDEEIWKQEVAILCLALSDYRLNYEFVALPRGQGHG